MIHAVCNCPSLLLGAVLLFAGSGVAFAQEITPHEEVTIEGPYTIHISVPPFHQGRNFAISRNVNYSDLDLSKDWGETLLTIRIKEAARDLCSEIENRYPGEVYKPTWHPSDCPFNATRDAMAAASSMMAAARGRANRVAALH